MTYSIIIPTFNSANYIRRCLDSIVAQTYKDFEVLVMDGASKDETVEIAQSYNDKRIKVYSENDRGIYDAMNKGIDRSMGEWLLFMGSDDYLFNSEVLYNVLQHLSNDYDVVYGESDSHWSEMHRGEWSLEKLEANRVHQAIFYNRHFFGLTLRYNLNYPILADYDMNLRWLLNKDYRHKYIPVTISHMSEGGVSGCVRDEKFFKDFGLNALLYNKNVLTPKYKKCLAKRHVRNNPDKKLLNVLLRLYANIMSIIQIMVHILCHIEKK